MVHLDYRDARPIYSQIVDNFKEQILAGILQQRDRLPSVRELAAELTINPNTIQRAYRELEMEGWIASVAGKGSFVCGVPGGAMADAREQLQEFDALAKKLMQQGISPEELIRRLQQGGNEHA